MTKNIPVPTITAEGAHLPLYASDQAAGADVRAHLTQDVILQPGQSALIPTGLKFAIPEGFEIQVRPRSGLAFKNGITVLNSPGTIDSDYRGELGIILINHSQQSFTVTDGMRDCPNRHCPRLSSRVSHRRNPCYNDPRRRRIRPYRHSLIFSL